MKQKYRYHINEKEVERIGIVMALCIYVPYFYILCWLTQIACVIKIFDSGDNPDYKVPWLLFVMILPVEDMHPQLLADLSKAEAFIYMDYFIIEEGKFWNSILDILKTKAARGGDVKVIPAVSILQTNISTKSSSMVIGRIPLFVLKVKQFGS